jgi:hypothetical protein
VVRTASPFLESWMNDRSCWGRTFFRLFLFLASGLRCLLRRTCFGLSLFAAARFQRTFSLFLFSLLLGRRILSEQLFVVDLLCRFVGVGYFFEDLFVASGQLFGQNDVFRELGEPPACGAFFALTLTFGCNETKSILQFLFF